MRLDEQILDWALQDFNLSYHMMPYMTSKELIDHINSRASTCTQIMISQAILLNAINNKVIPLLDNKKVRFSEKNYLYLI